MAAGGKKLEAALSANVDPAGTVRRVDGPVDAELSSKHMRIDAIEEALQATPFVAFRIVLPSDRSLRVPHSEFVSIAPNRKWMLVWNKRGGWSLIDPALVVQLSFNGTKRR